jgi:hypothetical protein
MKRRGRRAHWHERAMSIGLHHPGNTFTEVVRGRPLCLAGCCDFHPVAEAIVIPHMSFKVHACDGTDQMSPELLAASGPFLQGNKEEARCSKSRSRPSSLLCQQGWLLGPRARNMRQWKRHGQRPLYQGPGSPYNNPLIKLTDKSEQCCPDPFPNPLVVDRSLHDVVCNACTTCKWPLGPST